MYNIAIIGAGQLGSRHLQGLKLTRIPIHIEVVDGSEKSLETARERYEQVAPNPSVDGIRYLSSLDALSSELDLVIVATGSAPRRAILEELLAKKTVRNLLLEKVLFPGLSDYPAVTTLLEEKGLMKKTWVNCTRRMFEGYKQLRTELVGQPDIRYDKSGSDWGMGCNSIHFIDHFMFLTGGEQTPSIDLSGLNPTVHESKRAGYVEFTGKLRGTVEKSGLFSLESFTGQNFPQSIVIYQGENRYDIDEAGDTILKNGEFWNAVGMKYQSALTNVTAEQILKENRCELTPYAESARLHLAFLRPLVEFYNSLTGNNNDHCPIT